MCILEEGETILLEKKPSAAIVRFNQVHVLALKLYHKLDDCCVSPMN